MPVADACVFCGIVAGNEIVSLVHQDDLSLGFLSLHQVRPGEIALVPREHIDHFTDVPDDVAAHLMRVAQRLGRVLRRNLKPERVGYVVHGYGVPHAHLMIVPLHEDTDITSAVLPTPGTVRWASRLRAFRQ